MKNLLSNICDDLDAIYDVTEEMMGGDATVGDILMAIKVRRSLLNILESTILSIVEAAPKEDTPRGVYSILNTVNGKIWYGASENLNRAETCVFGKLRDSMHDNNHLQNSYNKYGAAAFKFGIAKEYKRVNLDDALDEIVTHEIHSRPTAGGVYNYRVNGKWV